MFVLNCPLNAEHHMLALARFRPYGTAITVSKSCYKGFVHTGLIILKKYILVTTCPVGT